MNRYTVTVTNGDIRGIDGKDFYIHELRNHSVLVIYKEDDKKEPVAYFKDWVYFTINL